MSVFDPKTFGQMTFTETNSTVYVPIPAEEWPFEIKKSDISSWQSKDSSSAGLKCVLLLETTDAKVVEVTGREKNAVRYEIMLDLTPEGGLDFGKGMNVKLGKAREACGLNKPGQPFAFDMFIGHTVKAKIAHRAYEGNLQADCKAILPLHG